MSVDILQAEFVHLCLPQKLPTSEEDNLTDIESSLTKRILTSLSDLEKWTGTNDPPVCDWASLRRSIRLSQNAHRNGKVEKSLLLQQLTQIDEDACLILHIVEQNAGLLVYFSHSSENDSEVVFEIFEASALSEHVLAAQNGLTWRFPGKCAAMPLEKFMDRHFQEALASFLEKASEESVKRFSSVACKADTILAEVRNTSDPTLISQILYTVIEALGRQANPLSLIKRVHDDAVWSQGGTIKPWRRSAWWLVLKVGVQRYLMSHYEPEHGRQIYKFLVANALRSLLDESATVLHPEFTHLIISKLARRLAKLETHRESCSKKVRLVSDTLFHASEHAFEASIDNANSAIKSVWDRIMRSSSRPLPQLSVRGTDRDFYLTLPNSSVYLQGLYDPLRNKSTNSQSKDQLRAGSLLASEFIMRHYEVVDVEERLKKSLASLDTHIHPSKNILFISRELGSYIDMTSTLYPSDPEQCGQVLLLTFELWVALDKATLTQFPLLKEFIPPFHPQMLNVLQLRTSDQMRRLRLIQAYLNDRMEGSSSNMTIFSDPVSGCFAERYYDSSLSSSSPSSLQTLHASIESAQEIGKSRKEREWQSKHDQDRDLREKIANSQCFRQISVLPMSDDEHCKKCTRCFHKRRRRRIKILPLEDPLPHKVSQSAQLKAVLFELRLPETFAKYRDVTWKLRSSWATGQDVKKSSPPLLLREYDPLKKHASSLETSVTLASRSKPFLQTHYGEEQKFPVDLKRLFFDHGCEYHYFDNRTGAFIHDFSIPTELAHHFSLHIPIGSPYVRIADLPEFKAGCSGYNSNEVIASQPKCPTGLNLHEWQVFLGLTSGYASRWPKILTELGSSNLNFGSEANVKLLTRLVLEVGPTHSECLGLGLVHHIFENESFCNRLVECIENQIRNISSNWREATAMALVVTFATRLLLLAPKPKIQDQAMRCLRLVRTTCLEWTRSLRREKLDTKDAQHFANFSQYCLRAALLVRRTFLVCLEAKVHLCSGDVASLVEASLSFQENLPSGQSKIPCYLRSDLVSDLKMMRRLRVGIVETCMNHIASILSAIDSTWSNKLSSQQIAQCKSSSASDPCWIRIDIQGSQGFMDQIIHYHVLEGHFLIDGQPVGALPADLRQSVLIQELYPHTALTAIPSDFPGLELRIWPPIGSQHIYIGSRKGCVVVRAFDTANRDWMELIPRDIFRGRDQSSPDLPLPLIDDCIHWWNINTSIIEIRDKAEPFKKKWSHWSLNFATRYASRNESYLMDPHSSLFARVTNIFQDFEIAHYIVVSRRKRILLELKRLKLSFQVFGPQTLECNELQATVDTDQDVGALYGLSGKIVIKDKVNPSQRSVLLPLGEPFYKRFGAHVQVKVQPVGIYGRYFINTTLGRIDCPTEPRLLYTLAMFHAYTSFILADPLTRRTGTEEALALLKSGKCHPWTPLPVQIREILGPVASLSPRVEYYPEHRKEMQQVFWDERLTQTIQHWELRPTIETILQVSDRLSTFDPTNTRTTERATWPKTHLENRLLRRCLRYIRKHAGSYEEADLLLDYDYPSRDRVIFSQTRKNIFDIVSIIEQEPDKFSISPNISKSLEAWPVTAGYKQRFVLLSLQDVLTDDLGSLWGHLVELCTHSTADDKFQLMIIFSLLAFSNPANTSLLKAIIAFYLFSELRNLEKPLQPSFLDYRFGQQPEQAEIFELVSASKISFIHNSNQSQVRYRKAKPASSSHDSMIAAETDWNRKCHSDLTDLVDHLLSQWPTETPQVRGFAQVKTIDTKEALKLVSFSWQRLYQNYVHSCYLCQVQDILDNHRTDETVAHPPKVLSDRRHYPRPAYKEIVPSLLEVLAKADLVNFPHLNGNLMEDRDTSILGSDSLHNSSQLFCNGSSHTRNLAFRVSCLNSDGQQSWRPVNSQQQQLTSQRVDRLERLSSILKTFETTKSAVRTRYAKDILDSLRALQTLRNETTDGDTILTGLDFGGMIKKCRRVVEHNLERLEEGLTQGHLGSKWLNKGHLWPCTSAVSVLTKLARPWSHSYGPGVQRSIIRYGITLTELQRSIRLDDSYRRGLQQKFTEDASENKRLAWSPYDYPEWLLIEIESNLSIRQEQVDVALATINPPSGSNSVVQLQMGRGKTSCIIPMAAAILANSRSLVRVIVPRPLLLQTAQVLQGRLGGVLDRQVRHIPFSRRTQGELPIIDEYAALHSEIFNQSGIVLALPEHIMSFQLCGFQHLVDDRVQQARLMIDKQVWLSSVCRDIMDESDQILSVKTQLIFPNGNQMAVDGHPWRWIIIENLLQLIHGYLPALKKEFPQSIDLLRISSEGFPIVHFLRRDVEEAMSSLLLRDVVRGCVRGLPTDVYEDAQLLLIRQFITEEDISKSLQESVCALFPDNPAALDVLHLIRGLLTQRILLVCLKKRYNVQYGLHPERTPVAVPFLAKGIPSQTAEWGHVDVSIILTVLSFYYSGLTELQLREGFQKILQSDDSAGQYDRWVQSAQSLPESLRHWNSVNADDDVQLRDLWHAFRHSTVVIDDYLNALVFPKHARQFATKIQSSGWDLLLNPSLNRSRNTNFESGSTNHIRSELRPCITTGFSGTNDNRHLLPLNVEQCDLKTLAHTNAEVMAYLLEERNQSYILAADQYGRRLSERRLLRGLHAEGIHILIDAGAQVFGLTNHDLAKAWLSVTDSLAAAYFDDNNRLMVLFRNSQQKVPLSVSPFAENMDECLLYLDQAHTRGVDIKLPPGARAALTLSLGQTKDDTVQAAMRLRQLATTQSIVWVAPPEVDQSIRDFRHKTKLAHIDSHDVVAWLIEQTCLNLEAMQPLFYAQGMEFCRRSQAVMDNLKFLIEKSQLAQLLDVLKQKERQTLQEAYGVSDTFATLESRNLATPGFDRYRRELESRRADILSCGTKLSLSAFSEVEQEREVEQEVESVREVQKPIVVRPYPVPGQLSNDLTFFLSHGRLPRSPQLTKPVFSLMASTNIGQKFAVNPATASGNLFASAAFGSTVATKDSADNYLRPVNWILLSKESDVAVLVSPEEAEMILATLHKQSVQAYLLTYSAPFTRAMIQFNHLNYLSLPTLPREWKAPTWLVNELGVFAGAIYFKYDDCRRVAEFLGIASIDDAHHFEEDKTEPGRGKAREGLVSKPLSFLQAWLDIRRKSSDFSHTPMGFLAQGRALTASHPFFKVNPRRAEGVEALDDESENDVGEVEVPSDGSDAAEEDLGPSDERDKIPTE